MSDMKSLKKSLGEKPFINPRNQKWFEQAVIEIENNREEFKKNFDKEFNGKGGIYKFLSGKFKGCCYSYLPGQINVAEREKQKLIDMDIEDEKWKNQEFRW